MRWSFHYCWKRGGADVNAKEARYINTRHFMMLASMDTRISFHCCCWKRALTSMPKMNIARHHFTGLAQEDTRISFHCCWKRALTCQCQKQLWIYATSLCYHNLKDARLPFHYCYWKRVRRSMPKTDLEKRHSSLC